MQNTIARQVFVRLGLLLSLPALSIACRTSPPVRDNPVQGPTRSRSAADIEQGFAAVLAARDLRGQVVGQASPDKVATAVVVFASWCGPCREELAMLGELVREEPRLRVIGVNFYEEWNDHGDEEKLRAFLAVHAPWLQVVRADDRLIDGLGRPSKVPTLFLFDRRGRLYKAYLRARRAPPDKRELTDSLAAIVGSES